MFDFSGDTPPCNNPWGCVGGGKFQAICCESCSECDSNCGWVLEKYCDVYTGYYLPTIPITIPYYY